MDRLAGMVVRSDGMQVIVRDSEGTDWQCVLRGRLRRELAGATSPIVVGDRVEFRATGAREGAVDRLLPRRSRLARRALTGHDRFHDGRPREHVLAANLDLAVIVVSAPPRPTVIDRYLAMATAGRCPALVCINKMDLIDAETVAAVSDRYREAGVPVLLTSALTGSGVQDLARAVAGTLAAFIGPSGAGKSSLLNAMDSELALRVGSMARSGKGRHTTTWAQIVPVADGLVVDTPGLREIGFVENEAAEAAPSLFPEISALAAECRFSDCSHTHEPRCGVKAALEAGRLDPDLYRRYTRLARAGRL